LKWTLKAGGGTLFVTLSERKNLELAARGLGVQVTVKKAHDVKVKDLLLRGRVVIEQPALEWLIQNFGVDTKRPPVERDPIRDYERLLKLL
jgi:ribosomal protein L4